MTQGTAEQRRAGRVRTILGAEAVFGRGLAPVPCQVKDLSETGARITVEESVLLPDRFEFRVPKKGMSQPAQVRWRRGLVLGIEFLREGASAVAKDPQARIKELEAENADLKRRMADMAERLYSYGDSERPAKNDFY